MAAKGRHQNRGLRKVCGCSRRTWAKCPHSWHFNFKPKGGPAYRFSIDAEAGTPDGETRVLARLSAQLCTSSDTLQAEHQAWGLGYGELAMAYGFARASRAHKTPAEVVEMRRQGTDWLDIAKQIGVKVDTVANRMNRHKAPIKR